MIASEHDGACRYRQDDRTSTSSRAANPTVRNSQATTLEWFDGKVFTVSAANLTRRTTDNPDEQLPLFVPGIPAIAGLGWYAARFAAAGRAAMTGRAVRTCLRWAQWPRRVALTIVISAYPAVFAGILGLGLSLTVVLIIWTVTAAVTIVVLAWRVRRGRAKPASGADHTEMDESVIDM